MFVSVSVYRHLDWHLAWKKSCCSKSHK